MNDMANDFIERIGKEASVRVSIFRLVFDVNQLYDYISTELQCAFFSLSMTCSILVKRK